MLDFTGQVAIVTGAGNGLGRRYALDLAARGARVVVNDIGVGVDGTANAESPATRVVEEIRAAGGEAVAATASVASTEGGESIVEQALASFGGLDILVNDAGIARTSQDGCRRHEPGAGTGGGYMTPSSVEDLRELENNNASQGLLAEPESPRDADGRGLPRHDRGRHQGLRQGAARRAGRTVHGHCERSSGLARRHPEVGQVREARPDQVDLVHGAARHRRHAFVGGHGRQDRRRRLLRHPLGVSVTEHAANVAATTATIAPVLITGPLRRKGVQRRRCRRGAEPSAAPLIDARRPTASGSRR